MSRTNKPGTELHVVTREEEAPGVAKAKIRADQIREGMRLVRNTLKLIADAYAERDWETLGYPDWDAYVNAEFDAGKAHMTADARREAVQALRLEGMSQPAIASALNTSQSTVDRDLANPQVTQMGNQPDVPSSDLKITGVDGKRQAAKKRAAEPKHNTKLSPGKAPGRSQRPASNQPAPTTTTDKGFWYRDYRYADGWTVTDEWQEEEHYTPDPPGREATERFLADLRDVPPGRESPLDKMITDLAEGIVNEVLGLEGDVPDFGSEQSLPNNRGLNYADVVTLVAMDLSESFEKVIEDEITGLPKYVNPERRQAIADGCGSSGVMQCEAF